MKYLKGHHTRIARPEIGPLDLQWLAGLLEGEGSFYVSRSHRRQSVARIQVGMNDEDVIARVAALLGTTYFRSGNRIWQTSLTGYYAEAMMLRLRPFMGVRRQGQIDYTLTTIAALREGISA